MLKNLKLGLTLVKYGFNIKQNILMCALFFVIGVILEIFTKGTNVIGVFYIVLIGMFALQMIISMGLSSLVASSPLQRPLQTTIPAITNLVIELAFFTIVLVAKFFFVKTGAATEDAMVDTLINFAMLVLFMFIYCGFCYKYFLAATIVFFIAVMAGNLGLTYSQFHSGAYEWIHSIGFMGAAGLCYATIILGCLAQIGLAKLFYKADFSKYAFKSVLQKM